MSVFILIWGTKTRDEVRGKVADICTSCNRIRAFVIHEHFQQPHLYFIPIGSWRRVSAVRRCASCDQQFPCIPTRYKEIVPIDIANQLSFSELLEQTNSFLAARNTGPTKDAQPKKSAPAAQQAQPSLANLRKKLDALDEASSELEFLAEELGFWKKLNAAQRENLSERIDAYFLEQSKLRSARDFLETLSEHWPNTIGANRAGLLVALTTVALIVLLVLVWLVVVSNRTELAQFMGIYVLVVGCGIFGASLFFKSSLQAAREAWLREHCTRIATTDGFVDREHLAQVLDEPVNHEWDSDRIRVVFAMRRFKSEILRQLERVS